MYYPPEEKSGLTGEQPVNNKVDAKRLIMLLDDLLKGKVPDVPLKVTIDDKSIMKFSIAAVMVVTITILLAHLLRSNKK